MNTYLPFFSSGMKTKLLLTLLTFNGFFCVNSAFAATVLSIDNSQNSANLSQTIAESIGFDPDTHSLVEFAINRALIAQKLGNCKDPSLTVNPGTPVNNSIDPNKQKTIRGRIAKPTTRSKEKPIEKGAMPVEPIPRYRHLAGARG